MKTKGILVSVLMPEPLYDHCAEVAERKHLGVSSLVREIILASAPLDVREAAAHLLKSSARAFEAAPPARRVAALDTRGNHDDLVARYRDEVMRLADRKWSENATATFLRIPYKVVQEIVTAEARRGTRKRRQKP